MHLSTELPAGLWVVEAAPACPRCRTGAVDRRPQPGETCRSCRRHGHRAARPTPARPDCGSRRSTLPAADARPISPPTADRSATATSDATGRIAAYQTAYATEPGSAEMPSAGRPFTAEVITALVAPGVGVTPVVLHTGVSSLEAHEPPYPERYGVPATTAERVNATHAAGGRVVAIGTTVVRALETVTDAHGTIHPGDGWTDVIVTPERGVRAVDGLLTGWHEPQASHLRMLEAVAGRPPLELAYGAALAAGLPLARVRRQPPHPAGPAGRSLIRSAAGLSRCRTCPCRRRSTTGRRRPPPGPTGWRRCPGRRWPPPTRSAWPGRRRRASRRRRARCRRRP